MIKLGEVVNFIKCYGPKCLLVVYVRDGFYGPNYGNAPKYTRTRLENLSGEELVERVDFGDSYPEGRFFAIYLK